MSETCPLRSPVLRDVARWWIDAYGGERLPSRHEIDHMAVRYALPYIWLVDWEADTDTFRYRLAGEHVNATFGFSLRGKLLSEIAEPHILDTVRQRFLHVVKGPGAVHASGRVYSRAGGHREGERLILPLADDGVMPTHLLGTTDYGSSYLVSPQPPPPEYMQEDFLSLDDVVSWSADLQADRRAQTG